jgi:hypothetical protein
MEKILNKLSVVLPGIKFTPSDSFYWSPKNSEVYYIPVDNKENIWSLLHEVSHAKLGHNSFSTDFELLKLEVEAWEESKIIAKKLGQNIDEDHIQDCLDTYRDWLHQRSTCPSCSNVCLQNSPNEYKCHNCYTVWNVSNSRFCRPYRQRRSSLSGKDTEKIQTFV